MRHGYQEFDKAMVMWYKESTSPLFLREQGARRLIAASAYLNWIVNQ